jgi:hypothetical protein
MEEEEYLFNDSNEVYSLSLFLKNIYTNNKINNIINS